ncbi:hypothetical protein [Mycoplasma mycoides]|uniref:hypothetical protein n=1 Tax=Mycoplasma mycoides TaxID=2102 RepID=UPI000346D618|nr:hypothetical protein [Mycoplasma mycoides]
MKNREKIKSRVDFNQNKQKIVPLIVNKTAIIILVVKEWLSSALKRCINLNTRGIVIESEIINHIINIHLYK